MREVTPAFQGLIPEPPIDEERGARPSLDTEDEERSGSNQDLGESQDGGARLCRRGFDGGTHEDRL